MNTLEQTELQACRAFVEAWGAWRDGTGPYNNALRAFREARTAIEAAKWEDCPECDGEKGKERSLDGYEYFWQECYMCKGTGKTEREE